MRVSLILFVIAIAIAVTVPAVTLLPPHPLLNENLTLLFAQVTLSPVVKVIPLDSLESVCKSELSNLVCVCIHYLWL